MLQVRPSVRDTKAPLSLLDCTLIVQTNLELNRIVPKMVKLSLVIFAACAIAGPVAQDVDKRGGNICSQVSSLI